MACSSQDQSVDIREGEIIPDYFIYQITVHQLKTGKVKIPGLFQHYIGNHVVEIAAQVPEKGMLSLFIPGIHNIIFVG
jgi:hypothetical protein